MHATGPHEVATPTVQLGWTLVTTPMHRANVSISWRARGINPGGARNAEPSSCRQHASGTPDSGLVGGGKRNRGGLQAACAASAGLDSAHLLVQRRPGRRTRPGARLLEPKRRAGRVVGQASRWKTQPGDHPQRRAPAAKARSAGARQRGTGPRAAVTATAAPGWRRATRASNSPRRLCAAEPGCTPRVGRRAAHRAGVSLSPTPRGNRPWASSPLLCRHRLEFIDADRFDLRSAYRGLGFQRLWWIHPCIRPAADEPWSAAKPDSGLHHYIVRCGSGPTDTNARPCSGQPNHCKWQLYSPLSERVVEAEWQRRPLQFHLDGWIWQGFS